MVAILELHYGAGNRNAALLFDFHPVRCGVTPALTGLDGTGQLDRARKQQQLFRQRGLARIGVRNDGKSAPSGCLAQDFR